MVNSSAPGVPSRPKAPTFSSVKRWQKINHQTLRHCSARSRPRDSSCFRPRTTPPINWPHSSQAVPNDSPGTHTLGTVFRSVFRVPDGPNIRARLLLLVPNSVHFSGRLSSKFGVCENRYLHATTTTTTSLCSSGRFLFSSAVGRRSELSELSRVWRGRNDDDDDGVTQWTCVQLTPIHRLAAVAAARTRTNAQTPV